MHNLNLEICSLNLENSYERMPGITFESIKTSLKLLFAHFQIFMCFLLIAACFDFLVTIFSTHLWIVSTHFYSFLLIYQSFNVLQLMFTRTGNFCMRLVVLKKFLLFWELNVRNSILIPGVRRSNKSMFLTKSRC